MNENVMEILLEVFLERAEAEYTICLWVLFY